MRKKTPSERALKIIFLFLQKKIVDSFFAKFFFYFLKNFIDEETLNEASKASFPRVKIFTT